MTTSEKHIIHTHTHLLKQGVDLIRIKQNCLLSKRKNIDSKQQILILI